MRKSLTATAAELLPEYKKEVEEETYSDNEEYQFLKTHLPRGVDIREALEYGFFEHKNRYWIRRSKEFEPVSNFTIKVLYLIRGVNAKRIVEITNYKGRKAVIDFAIEDLISVEKFKCKVESEGNYLFEGKGTDLARIKNKLFSLERPSLEIAQLGHQKGNLFAFANGIFDGKTFHEVDENGMVCVAGENYFIPVFGATQDEDSEEQRNYRKFIHRPTDITFAEWSKQFIAVYGDNGKVAIAFALFALFSDIIFEKLRAAPMLFLFGQRGSGKGTMANSLMALFGVPQDPVMLGGASTVVGFMRKLAQFRNAFVWMDEYKNDIDTRKVESLKNIWDRVGYERGQKDNTMRTNSTPVTSSAIVSGQEIPNAEPALMNRLCLLEFSSSKRDQAAIDRFDLLRKTEDDGITSCTIEALQYRGIVKEQFFAKFSEMSANFRTALIGQEIDDRPIKNYSILCATVWVLGELLELPFTVSNLMQICEKLILKQKGMAKNSNEVQQFFDCIEFLLSSRLIRNGDAIQVTDQYVKIRLGIVYPLYREAAQRQKTKALDRGTLENYLEQSAAYDEQETKRGSHRFTLKGPTTCKVFHQIKIKALYGIDLLESLQNEPGNP